MNRTYLQYYFLGLSFFLIPFLEFINKNYFVIDKNIASVLFHIFLSLFIFFILLNFLFNKIHFFYNGFYIFFLSFCFFISFKFLDLKNYINIFTNFGFFISFTILLILYFTLFLIISRNKFNSFFIFFGIFLLIYNFFILYSLINQKFDQVQSYSKKNAIFSSMIDNFPHNKENIYYFILDGMTSIDYVKKSFPDINEIVINDHINHLISKDFIIHEDSISNYNNTYLSFSALMQLDYTVTDSSDKYFDRNNFWPYLLSKPDNKPNLISILEEHNIGFKWYGNITASCKNYSFNKDFCPEKSVSNFFYVFNSFFYQTPLITFLRKFFPKFMLAGYGDNIDSVGNFLNDYKNLELLNKKFYLIHHLAPHPPYIHNADCSLKYNSSSNVIDEGYNGYKESYLCALKKIDQAVKTIIENDPKSLVVFTADHGWILKNENNINKDLLKFNIYNSLKIHDKCKKFVKDKMDTISTIRIVLGCNINKIPTLTDRKSYIGYQENNINFGKVLKAF